MYELLLWCGVAVGPLFIAVFLVEGNMRSGYQQLRQPVSALATGPRGWVQRANFFITGFLALALALGLYAVKLASPYSLLESLLVAVFGIGLLGAGFYVTDVTGLSADPHRARTREGILHDIFSLLAFAPLLVSCFLFGHMFLNVGENGWALYSRLSGIVLLVTFFLAGAGFAGKQKLSSVGGLMQRIAICSGWLWLSVVSAHLLGIL